MRFPAEVLRRVKQAVGQDMAVLAKINVADGVPRGATVEDAIVTARALQAAGADMLVLSGGHNIESGWFIFGSNFNMEEMHKVLKDSGWLTSMMLKLSQLGAPRVGFKEMYFLEYSRQIRAAIDVPLGYLGGVKSMDHVRTALADGFDAVVLARAGPRTPAGAAFPEWPTDPFGLHQLQRLRALHLPPRRHLVHRAPGQRPGAEPGAGGSDLTRRARKGGRPQQRLLKPAPEPSLGEKRPGPVAGPAQGASCSQCRAARCCAGQTSTPALALASVLSMLSRAERPSSTRPACTGSCHFWYCSVPWHQTRSSTTAMPCPTPMHMVHSA